MPWLVLLKLPFFTSKAIVRERVHGVHRRAHLLRGGLTKMATSRQQGTAIVS